VSEVYDSARRLPPMTRELVELVRYRDLAWQLVARNLKVRYKRSLLGVAASMAGPLLTLVMLSLVFTTVFSATTPRYPVYLFSGFLLWHFFAQTTAMTAGDVLASAGVWKRIYAPRTVFPVATVCTNLVHLAFAAVPLIIVLVVYRSPVGLPLLVVPLAIVCTAMFALGVGLVLSALAVTFVDVGDLYSALLGAWLYCTPVIYPQAVVGGRFDWLFALNPMTHFVEMFRAPIYANAVPALSTIVAACGLAVVTLAAGWWLFTRSIDAVSARA
jgi:homopolymeric O-antigen transport system permease protein